MATWFGTASLVPGFLFAANLFNTSGTSTIIENCLKVRSSRLEPWIYKLVPYKSQCRQEKAHASKLCQRRFPYSERPPRRLRRPGDHQETTGRPLYTARRPGLVVSRNQCGWVRIEIHVLHVYSKSSLELPQQLAARSRAQSAPHSSSSPLEALQVPHVHSKGPGGQAFRTAFSQEVARGAPRPPHPAAPKHSTTSISPNYWRLEHAKVLSPKRWHISGAGDPP